MGNNLFIELLTNEIQRRGLTVREAAKEIGISHTTLYAVIRGRTMDVDIAVAICKWAGISLDTLMEGADKRTNTLTALDVVLRASPDLERVFIDAARSVEAGEMTLQDFKELANYTAYLIQRRRDLLDKDDDQDGRTFQPGEKYSSGSSTGGPGPYDGEQYGRAV